MPDATSGRTMGVILSARTSNANPAIEGDASEATTIKEELEIEEINRALTETM
jgi:hypothetical protein